MFTVAIVQVANRQLQPFNVLFLGFRYDRRIHNVHLIMSPDLRDVLNSVDVSVHKAWLTRATDEQLDEYIITATNPRFHEPAIAERQKRQLDKILAAQNKIHWTTTPTFWVALIAALTGIATLVVGVCSWLYPRTPQTPIGKFESSSASTVLKLTNSQPMIAPQMPQPPTKATVATNTNGAASNKNR